MNYSDPFQIVVPEKYPLSFPHSVYQYNRITEESPLKYVIIHRSKDPKYNFQYFDYENFDVSTKADFQVFPSIAFVNNKRIFNYCLNHFLLDPLKNITPKISNTQLGSSSSEPINFSKKYEKVTGKIEFTISDSLSNGNYDVYFTVGKPIFSMVKVRKFDCLIDSSIKIGLIKSFDNTLENYLTDLNIDYNVLDEDELRKDTLSEYSTIIIDVESYSRRIDLIQNNNRILEYVKNGGNLIVLSQAYPYYHKKQKFEFAPFQLDLSQKTILDEKAEIKITTASHPFFTYPNKIRNEDWIGWIQERGKNFPGFYSKEFQELVTSNDPGESEIKSSILFGRFGKGTYTYTSFSWIRQLREVVEGAYKIFTNMISLPRGK
jgi:hypothetical protein